MSSEYHCSTSSGKLVYIRCLSVKKNSSLLPKFAVANEMSIGQLIGHLKVERVYSTKSRRFVSQITVKTFKSLGYFPGELFTNKLQVSKNRSERDRSH